MDANRICPHTQIRREACACSACTRQISPDSKHRANKRDVLALLDFIADCMHNHHEYAVERATWSHVGTMAALRARLFDLAAGFSLDAGELAQSRIEEALCSDDEEVGAALVEAL